MRTRAHILLLLLCLAACGISGCRRSIVRASPSAVILSPQPSPPPPEPEPPPDIPLAAAEPEPLPSLVPDPIAPASRPAPARPRPAPVVADVPKAEPEPAPPQISPALTPQQQADAIRLTTNDVRTAEKNLQLSAGKRLNASQSDLALKVRAFLEQAHEAIRANDWVRAQNLAQKAEILSVELIKSL